MNPFWRQAKKSDPTPLVEDLERAADVIEILKMDRYRQLAARLRKYARKLREEDKA